MRKNKKVGERFGRLILKEKIKTETSRPNWLCKCDCGNEKIIHSSNIGKGTSSCGCLRNEVATARLKTLNIVKYERGVGSANFLWNKYKQSANKRNLEFKLSKIFFKLITSENCFYCKSPPIKTIKGPG